MEDFEFDALLEEMRQGQCILIMGPEAHLMERYPEDALPSHFEVIVKANDKLQNRGACNLQDGFFTCSSTSKEKPMIFQAIKDYYRQLKPPQFYQYLAALPFNMVISLSPDNLMEQTMRQLGYPYDFAFYKKNSTGLYLRKGYTGNALNDFQVYNDLEQQPSSTRPLLFNMLGYYEYSDSLLFTYEALFEFLYSNFPVERIPNRLRTAISNASAYLFVGFGYHQWYLKIFFFMLEKIISSGVKKLAGKAIFNYGDTFQDTVGVYEKVFPLSFYKSPTQDFSQRLFSGLRDAGYAKAASNTGPYRILFVASLPDGKMPLRQSKEWKDIRQTLAVAEAKGMVVMNDLFCASIDELLLELNRYSPDMLVMSMHGRADGLFFEDASGDTQVVDTALLLQNLETSKLNPGYRLKSVFLGACHSEAVAKSLSDMVEVTIGFSGPVYDEAVALFSKAFFANFADRFDVAGSVETGKQVLTNSGQYADARNQVCVFGKAANIRSRISTVQTAPKP